MPAGECFIQLQIGKKIYRDRVTVIENLRCDYICIGQIGSVQVIQPQGGTISQLMVSL